MLRKALLLISLFSVLLSTSACSAKKKEADVVGSPTVRKIAQKVAPLEPTFKPKQAAQPKVRAPITIPPVN